MVQTNMSEDEWLLRKLLGEDVEIPVDPKLRRTIIEQAAQSERQKLDTMLTGKKN